MDTAITKYQHQTKWTVVCKSFRHGYEHTTVTRLANEEEASDYQEAANRKIDVSAYIVPPFIQE